MNFASLPPAQLLKAVDRSDPQVKALALTVEILQALVSTQAETIARQDFELRMANTLLSSNERTLRAIDSVLTEKRRPTDGQ